MSTDGLLPSYDRLFGDLDLRPADETRSVYSPAAYLADLLKLAADSADGSEAGDGLAARRPDLAEVPLDAEHSYTELPYLDIVNEVLAKQLTVPAGTDVWTHLATLPFPFVAPFSLGHERVRQYLRHLGVDPVELYRRFTPAPTRMSSPASPWG
ncbi:Tc toxin subunit A [Phytohabitans flavus]|uniref:Tc toxin subunit A n=1 Tax=Phytohabitans flavus TaxID=1076124 RepID=UPI003640E429